MVCVFRKVDSTAHVVWMAFASALFVRTPTLHCLSPSSTHMHGQFLSVAACVLTPVVRSETTLPGYIPSVQTFRTYIEYPVVVPVSGLRSFILMCQMQWSLHVSNLHMVWPHPGKKIRSFCERLQQYCDPVEETEE